MIYVIKIQDGWGIMNYKTRERNKSLRNLKWYLEFMCTDWRKLRNPPRSHFNDPVLLLSSHLRVDIPCFIFPSDCLTEILYPFLFFPVRATCLSSFTWSMAELCVCCSLFTFCWLFAWFTLFCPDDGSSTFLRNLGERPECLHHIQKDNVLHVYISCCK